MQIKKQFHFFAKNENFSWEKNFAKWNGTILVLNLSARCVQTEKYPDTRGGKEFTKNLIFFKYQRALKQKFSADFYKNFLLRTKYCVVADFGRPLLLHPHTHTPKLYANLQPPKISTLHPRSTVVSFLNILTAVMIIHCGIFNE